VKALLLAAFNAGGAATVVNSASFEKWYAQMLKDNELVSWTTRNEFDAWFEAHAPPPEEPPEIQLT
jgi:hypothetical protein